MFRIFVPLVLYFCIVWTSTFFGLYAIAKGRHGQVVGGYDKVVVQAFVSTLPKYGDRCNFSLTFPLGRNEDGGVKQFRVGNRCSHSELWLQVPRGARGYVSFRQI